MNSELGNITREMDGYKVIFNRILHHPIEKVWAAITDPKQLKYWFTDVEMDFRLGGKITFYFRDADRTVSYGEIVSIDPPHRFVWTWEGELAVWELKKLDDRRTHLALTYSKLSEDYAVSAPAGFHSLLDRLVSRLQGSEEVHPFGTESDDPGHLRTKVRYAAAAFNRYPEVVKSQPALVEKVYDASVERVWKAITDIDQMKQWYFDLDDFKPEIGFTFTFPGQGHKGAQYRHICTITEVIPFRKLQYSWEYKDLPGYSIVTFELFQEGGSTRLRLTHHGLETFPQDNADFAKESFIGGWTELITKLLSQFLEGVTKV